MLTAKENLRAAIKGKAERYVNQYEALGIGFSGYDLAYPRPEQGKGPVKNAWGVVNEFPANSPGSFPVHSPETTVVKDIEHWKDYVKAPSLEVPEELWDISKGMLEAVDNTKAFRSVMIAPGLFEQTHHLCSINEALVNYMVYPDEMHELIEYLTDFELRLAEKVCEKLHPECIFHHDDWGTEINSFLSPEMFAEFFLEPYKKIYGYYHSHGVELIVHHSDSYAANLVPCMIEMGVDIWQGCMSTNDVPALVKKYGGQISFMGAIDNKFVDHDGWTPEECEDIVRRITEECGPNYFIPCITQGGPGSVYKGAYKALWDAIDKVNQEKFSASEEELNAARMPISIMF